jgi:hypothetical protein
MPAVGASLDHGLATMSPHHENERLHCNDNKLLINQKTILLQSGEVQGSSSFRRARKWILILLRLEKAKLRRSSIHPIIPIGPINHSAAHQNGD